MKKPDGLTIIAEELKEWLPKIEGLDGQTEKLFIFMNNHFGGKATTNALMLAGMLKNRLGAVVPGSTGATPAQGALPMRTQP